jgi:hypothetical protein
VKHDGFPLRGRPFGRVSFRVAPVICFLPPAGPAAGEPAFTATELVVAAVLAGGSAEQRLNPSPPATMTATAA